MQIEFHQLDRRWEPQRAQHPARQKRLLASLAAHGQLTPIVVIALAEQPERYLVIDGYQRIRALHQLGRDTVEAVIWPGGELDAVLLEHALRMSRRLTALEEGWLLEELEQRFSYSVEDLARRFDRSPDWVARRLALVELLPEEVQQGVRDGEITAQLAVKYLAPMARTHREDCRRMAGIYARRKASTREAAQLYDAWRNATAAVRERILNEPELFLKAQRQREPASPTPSAAALVGDLESIVALAERAQRRLSSGTEIGMSGMQCQQARRHIEEAIAQLSRLAAKLPREEQVDDESQSTHRDSGVAPQGSVPAGDRASAEDLAHLGARCRGVEHRGGARVESAGEAEPYRAQILELMHRCKGNLVRVHEELTAGRAELSYSALTAFCRRHEIGQEPKQAVGQYDFPPGQEMQHDTSPHDVELGGEKRRVQTASLVLCYSRMLFFQCYPTFGRFECKVFLTDAFRYLGGVAQRAMIDNTHVVVLRGSGRDMVPVPEMTAFGERFGFQWIAHAIGNANRSGRVERPFAYIEGNFLAGRTFASWEDLNLQARHWCDKVNATEKRHLHAAPLELFASERLRLKPLPVWIPEVYRLHQRTADVEAYVSLHGNRYSVPVEWIGRRVEVRETYDKVEMQLDARQIVTHARIVGTEFQRVTLPEHRPPRGQKAPLPDRHPEEKAILEAAPELAGYVTAMKQRGRKTITLGLRQLHRMVKEYPREAVLGAVEEAARYGLYDLERLERMILRRVARDYFRMEGGGQDD